MKTKICIGKLKKKNLELHLAKLPLLLLKLLKTC